MCFDRKSVTTDTAKANRVIKTKNDNNVHKTIQWEQAERKKKTIMKPS